MKIDKIMYWYGFVVIQHAVSLLLEKGETKLHFSNGGKVDLKFAQVSVKDSVLVGVKILN